MKTETRLLHWQVQPRWRTGQQPHRWGQDRSHWSNLSVWRCLINGKVMKQMENTLQSAACCLLKLLTCCFGSSDFLQRYHTAHSQFAKLRPRMRSDRVGAKPVSRLPNVSSSPATISAWTHPIGWWVHVCNCTSVAAETQHVGLACSSHSSSQQCYWPKQKPQPQSKWSRHRREKLIQNHISWLPFCAMRSKPILAAGVQNDVGALNLQGQHQLLEPGCRMHFPLCSASGSKMKRKDPFAFIWEQ